MTPSGTSTEQLWGRLRVVCASANPDKVAEIQAILGDAVELVARPEHVPDVFEDADTLLGNARLKARALVEATGLPAVADDTGLEVDALGGAPGVYTARFAGEGASYADNRSKLLIELAEVPMAERGAAFKTVVVLRWPDGRELTAEGVCPGHIATEERGGRGFGYDAVFVPDELGRPGTRTFAEMAEEDKHAISHRGHALRALLAALDESHT